MQRLCYFLKIDMNMTQGSGVSHNPIDMLKKDHQKVQQLFREYESTSGKSQKRRQDIADKVFIELEIHAALEEEVFYPSVEAGTAEESAKMLVAKSREEHAMVKTLIDEMRGMGSDDPEFEANFKILAENVESHIEEEESELFPQAEKSISGDFKKIAEEMTELKAELTAM
jgi:hemerythrin-like domain-containing protein